MPTLPTQKLINFYETYGDKELAFNKSIIDITGLETKKVFLKIRNGQLPCVVYSSSMKTAKVIATLGNEDFEEIKKANNYVNLRLSFSPEKDMKNPIMFFVPSIVKSYNPFNMVKQISNDGASVFIVSLEFSQRPPEDLIEIMGRIMEANDNFLKRKALRINIDNRVCEDMGVTSNKITIEMTGIKKPCILKNASSFGCMVILAVEDPKAILLKRVKILIPLLRDESDFLLIEGEAVRAEPIPNSVGIYGIGIAFDENFIPFEWKEMLNKYLDKLEQMAKRKV